MRPRSGLTERLRYTSPPTRAVMPTPTVGEPHDRTAHLPRHPTRGRPGPNRRPEDRDHAGAEAAMARTVRQGTAAGQPAVSGKPARLPHPGAGVRRPETRNP